MQFAQSVANVITDAVHFFQHNHSIGIVGLISIGVFATMVIADKKLSKQYK